MKFPVAALGVKEVLLVRKINYTVSKKFGILRLPVKTIKLVTFLYTTIF